MKKLFVALSLIFLFFTGCEKDYNEIINPVNNNIVRIQDLAEIDSLDFGLGDSIIHLKAKAIPPELIADIQASLTDPFGKVLINIPLFDNGSSPDSIAGDSIYSNSILMSDEYPSGQFTVSYFINSNRLAVQNFFFENGKEKFPPVISDLNIRDSVTFNEEMIFNIRATDLNGYEDIVLVYFEFFRPDGSQVINSDGISKFPMNDTGNPEFKDPVAMDSIYTFYLNFPPNVPNVPAGTWRLEFEAVDRSNRLSNKIIHYLEVH